MSRFFSPPKILESLILFQIENRGSLHGYGLTSSIEEEFDWKPSQTAIYNALKSLEKDEKVSSEEKIENGRVQKIYSITKKGQSLIEKTKEKIKGEMVRKFIHLFSFMVNFSEADSQQDSKDIQSIFKKTLKDVKEIQLVFFQIIKIAPKETNKAISEALISLKEIAKENNISLKKFEDICDHYKIN